MTAGAPTILVIEDNPTALKLFRLTLESEGYRVLEAGDARAALVHLERECPGLVLQDLVLPDHDGLELARRIRAWPGCAELPIVLMSGFPGLLDRARSEPGCFDATLVKPVVPSVLVDVVRRYLAPPTLAAERFGAGRTILIVDDDPIQLKLATLRFAAAGFEVATATDSATALASALAAPPAIVLCDVLMPGTDGYELCVALRGIPSLAATPVVLVSAHYGGPRDEALARAAGASALVTRSPTAQETLAAVRASLDGEVVFPTQAPEFDKQHTDRVIAQLKRQARAHEGIAERAALQSAQLSVLAGISNALARSGDIDEALDDVLAACLDAGGISRGALYRVGADDRMVVSNTIGFPGDATTRAAVDQLFGFPTLLALADHGTVVAPGESLSEADATTLFARAGVARAVIVPVMDGADRIGALLLGTDLDLGVHDLTVFGRVIAAHIAQALTLTGAFARLQASAAASRALTASLDVGTTLASLGRLATAQLAHLCQIQIGAEPAVVYGAPALPADVAAALAELHRRYPDRPVLSTVGTPAPGERAVVVARSTDDDDDAMHPPAVDDDHARLLRALQPAARITVPLIASDHHFGTVTFARLRGARRFRDVDVLEAEDLTQRAAIAIDHARLYQTVRDANVAKDEFLATVSHELRTPLHAMMGWAELLRGGLHPARAPKAIEAIERNARAQAALIDDLLDMSRIVSGKMRLEPEAVQLGRIVETAIESLRPKLEARGVVLRPVTRAHADTMFGDPARLHQIVCNLLGNAIKFTPMGGHVGVALSSSESGLTLTVTDDGDGIEPTVLPHIFERFKQADSSTSRAHGGLGLGLAITRHLVELHGGTVEACSAGPGAGACFTVRLPRSATAAPPAEPASAPHPTRELDGVSILVVDDEPDAREMMVTLLEELGAAARAVCSAREALVAIADRIPDILLSDLGMPGEDGYAMMRKIRALPSTDGGAIPAVAVSGFASTEDRQRALAAGFQGHLAKPVRVMELLSTIQRLSRAARSVG